MTFRMSSIGKTLFCLVLSMILLSFSWETKLDIKNLNDTSAVRIIEEGGQVKLIAAETILELKNNLATIKIDKQNGSFLSIGSFGNNLLDQSGAGNFTLYVDVKTNDLWQANPHEENLVRVSSRDIEVSSYEISDIADGKQLTLNYEVNFNYENITYTGIYVKQNLRLLNSESFFSVDYEINNNCNGVTVVNIVACQIGNISEENDFSLFWPFNEGEIHADAVRMSKNSSLRVGKEGMYFALENQKKLSVSYPSSMSMQLTQLYNNTEGIYMFVKDENNEYKHMNFGIFDKDNGCDIDKPGNVSLSIKLYPYIEPGQSKTTAPIILGVQSEGGWYAGADIYREWRLSLNPRFKNFSNTVKNLSAMASVIVKHYGAAPLIAYNVHITGGNNDFASIFNSIDPMGVDNCIIMGWHQDGFDTKYPDYNFLLTLGGENAFRSGIDKVHRNQNDDKIFGYINIVSALRESDWYSENSNQGDRAAVKDHNGNILTFGRWIIMSPASAEWQNAILEAVDKLARNGIDGIFFDQLMEWPASLDYDRGHGHETPATAYGKGFKTLLTAVNEKMQTYTNDYLITGEGILDAYDEFVDVAALMWGRGMKFSDYSYPEISRYTIPMKMLGVWNTLNPTNTPQEYATSILMGNPLLLRRHINNPIIPLTSNIYKTYPEIYSVAHYIAEKGVNKNCPVEIGVVKANDMFVVSFYNPIFQSMNCEIEFDLEKMGYENKSIATIEDLFQGNAGVDFNEDRFTINLSSKSIKSYLVKLDEKLETSITDTKSSISDVIVYPNPTTGQIEITSKGFDFLNSTVSFYDSLGNHIIIRPIKIDSNGVMFNINKLKSGIYFVKLGNMASQEVVKLIKQ